MSASVSKSSAWWVADEWAVERMPPARPAVPRLEQEPVQEPVQEPAQEPVQEPAQEPVQEPAQVLVPEQALGQGLARAPRRPELRTARWVRLSASPRSARPAIAATSSHLQTC
jgi:hypothetical protein